MVGQADEGEGDQGGEGKGKVGRWMTGRGRYSQFFLCSDRLRREQPGPTYFASEPAAGDEGRGRWASRQCDG